MATSKKQGSRVGIEIGGTFTDLVSLIDGNVSVVKVPSVRSEPDIGAINALERSGILVSELEHLAHGSTVATNAVLERKGARLAFLTTTGFRDILVIQRHNRRDIYDLAYKRPQHVVERRDCYEVDERVLADGTVLTPLNLDAIGSSLVQKLGNGRYEAIAICLLNSYVNPDHERRLAAFLRDRLPGVLVTASSDVCLKFREYERASTAVLSAYVQPVIERYLTRFEQRLAERGFTGHLSVIQSNGGRLPADGMRQRPVSALLSGPAAGVSGAVHAAGESGFSDIIALDIGGTSTDISLIRNGKPDLAGDFEINSLPVHTPVIDINTVGAGGGSIVWVDDGGMLRVGPQSAGAEPGPACYGRGGDEPTITDAHVVCGSLRPDAFLGGDMKLDRDAAHSAFRNLADSLNMSIEKVAESAVGLAVASIVRAVQIVSTERGTDPRDFVLTAYGGAGGLHAAAVAEELGIKKALVPANAGVLSAYGLLTSDYQLFETMTHRVTIESDADREFLQVYEVLLTRALSELKQLGIEQEPEIRFWADMRYVGQAFEVTVLFTSAEIAELSTAHIRKLFIDAHRKLYFHDGHGGLVEAVAFRLGVRVPVKRPVFKPSDRNRHAALPQHSEIFRNGKFVSCEFCWLSSMSVGDRLRGLALAADGTTTVTIPEGWTAATDAVGNILLSRDSI